MNKCPGCGATLQTTDATLEGYTKSIHQELCERCFRIQHYHEYQPLKKSNEEFLPLLQEIGKTENLVMLVVDLFQVPQNLNLLTNVLKNPILLVLTKRDLLPRSLYEERLKQYFHGISKQIVDTVVVSSYKNYHLDELMKLIQQHQTSRKVYVLGYTNAGKSSLINKIIEDYTTKKSRITTSMLPSTTISKMEIAIHDNLTLIDTPGLLEQGSMLEILEEKDFKRVVPKKTIRPIVWQVKNPQMFGIDHFAMIDCHSQNDLVFYFSNDLKIERFKNRKMPLPNWVERKVQVHPEEDVVIVGLGFLKSMKEDTFVIYIDPRVQIYVRKSLI